MNDPTPLPRYEADLGLFLGDLRATIFSSQSEVARALQLSHSTVSRYENGRLRPPTGYLAYLAMLAGQRLVGPEARVTLEPSDLLAELNEAVRWCYPGEPTIGDWPELRRLAEQYLLERRRPASARPGGPAVDWEDAPAVRGFVNRQAELARLARWCVAEQKRFVGVVGLAGMGKTVLVTHLAEQIQSEFEIVIWRSLRHWSTFGSLLEEIAAAIGQHDVGFEALPADDVVRRVLKLMRAHRCLLVLDGLDTFMREESDGEQVAGNEAFHAFVRAAATSRHESCVIVTTRVKPVEFYALAVADEGFGVLQLDGFSVAEARVLLAKRPLRGTADDWRRMVEHYSGNPLALKLIAEIIVNCFAGDVRRFLNSGNIMVGDIRRLIAHQFEGLPAIARLLCYWLAIEGEPRPLESLRRRLIAPPPGGGLLDAVQALERSSLISCRKDRFTLPRIVAEYVTDLLIRRLHSELVSGQLDILRQVALVSPNLEPSAPRAQADRLLEPLAVLLTNQYSRRGARDHVGRLLSAQQRKRPPSPGYAVANLAHLRHYLGQTMGAFAVVDLPVSAPIPCVGSAVGAAQTSEIHVDE